MTIPAYRSENAKSSAAFFRLKELWSQHYIKRSTLGMVILIVILIVMVGVLVPFQLCD